MSFRAPKCPVCRRVQRASSALQHSKGNYACLCNSENYQDATDFRKKNRHSEEACSDLAPDELIMFTVLGEPAVKKNSMRIVSFGGRSSIRPSILYEVWASRALYQIKMQWLKLNRKPIKGPVEITVQFYRSTKRDVDLSNLYEGIQDCLTTAGVWIDDTIVQSHDGSRKHYSKDNPRVEVIITKYEEKIDG